MLPFADKTITLYNRYEGLGANGKTYTTWHRWVLNNCSWGKSTQVLSVGTTQIGSDDIQIKIPEDTDYLPFWDWQALPNDEMILKFTVRVDDIVVLGNVDDEITATFTTTKLKNKYAGRVMTVKFFNDATGKGFPLGHYSLTGK